MCISDDTYQWMVSKDQILEVLERARGEVDPLFALDVRGEYPDWGVFTIDGDFICRMEQLHPDSVSCLLYFTDFKSFYSLFGHYYEAILDEELDKVLITETEEIPSPVTV